MNTTQQSQVNQAAYARLRDSIKQKYPAGRFVAIFNGQIVADAASFEDLDVLLHRSGHRSSDVLVVQAGVEYPESVVIFVQDLSE
jgi:hypothetical protein